MDSLSSTPGVVALAAAGVAAVALLLAGALAWRLRRVRRDQAVVLGGESAQDLVAHSAALQRDFGALRDWVEEIAARLDGRMGHAETRLDGTIAHHAVVRYDAYGELSGHQSTSIALLDVGGSGVVLSSIVHREQARLYAKAVREGRGELELSPEEADAVKRALAGESEAPAASAEG